ncbi:MAG: type II toxin-antitoxin system RelE/ParE family toxin [Eubacteriaceae bacterium]|nr:type II toxin-antitoxin system RelE/ParE family toxin [Eubacteriaceae bacterium]
MYKIIFYQDSSGHQPVKEYIRALAAEESKDSRIRLNKIRDYIKVLETRGTRAGEPFVKHLDGAIWEIRPLRDRILFAGWCGDSFVLLSHFVKKTQKTPKREIDKAKRLFADFLERSK